MLNKYIWNLYLDAGGREVVETFRKNINEGISEEYISFIYDLQNEYCASSEVLKDTQDLLHEVYDIVKQDPPESYQNDQKDVTDKEIEEIFSEIYEMSFKKKGMTSDKDEFLSFSSEIAGFSTSLAIDYPDIFIPYYFYCNYNVLTMVAEAFDMQLPKLPKKADYKGRIWHYVRLCIALKHFRVENDISPYELLAFLYDFAPKYIGGKDSYILKELPDPKSAFFIGGGGDNDDAVAENDPDRITRWQCSPDTRAGDMIVMYLRAPISSISSIWRSYSVGFIDPIFYHYRCTYIGSPRKMKRIPLDKIKKDAILGKMPIINKNMQGINGVELKPSEYNHIVEKGKVDVLLLEFVMESDDDSYVNEKAVEEKLIKPLISKLGYAENEYVQQLSIPVGNHNTALIPDFVMLPKCAGGHYSAYAIIEAKRTIIGEKKLVEVKTQARSYAKMLGVRYAAIASQEKIWITSSKDDYSETIFECTWGELKDGDTFYALRRLMGNF